MKKSLGMGIITVFVLIITMVYGFIGNERIDGKTDHIQVVYNNRVIEFDTEPVILNNRTMVPLRGIFEVFGMTVEWNSERQEVTAIKDTLEIKLTIQSKEVLLNNQVLTIDVEPYIKDNRTMVPLRFIAEATGAELEWNNDTMTVNITDVSTDTSLTYKIVDTAQTTLYSDKRILTSIEEGESFYGQDGNYSGYQPDYKDNGDKTVTDHVTNLMWQQTMNAKMSYDEVVEYANASSLAGYTDWRIPTIKELFSLIQYTGQSGGESAKTLFIDTTYFDQPIGDVSIGEREIDAQVWSSTKYVGLTMNGDETLFGVNFIDGRIKGYAMVNPKTREENKMYFRLVRGNENYGENSFVDNGDGTISDLATGLMWQMSDDGDTKDWEEALEYCENLELAGYGDWRLPNAKELQSIVDYTKSMQTSKTAAINDVFKLTQIVDSNGNTNYGYYWTGTTHQDGPNVAANAVYVAFGEALGEMFGKVIDVHGAGAVRSDPKSGTASDYPEYFGPQGDARYVYNFVLAVRSE